MADSVAVHSCKGIVGVHVCLESVMMGGRPK